MKRLIPVALLLLIMSGCNKKPDENATKGLNAGLVHFATIAVLDDLMTDGAQSDFISLSPVPIVNPDDAVTAEAILEDFRTDFVNAQDQYPLKLSDGLAITWNLNYNADAQYGMAFHKESRSKGKAFAGRLSLRFDPAFYSAAPYPAYAKNTSITVICRKFAGATEQKNNHMLGVEVTFNQCMAVADYDAWIKNQLKNGQDALKERLTHVFSGNEQVSEAVAHKLLTYYLAGQAFAADSVCLTGEREACFTNLKTEIFRKYENAELRNIETMKTRAAQAPADNGLKAETTAEPAAKDQPVQDSKTSPETAAPPHVDHQGASAVTPKAPAALKPAAQPEAAKPAS